MNLIPKSKHEWVTLGAILFMAIVIAYLIWHYAIKKVSSKYNTEGFNAEPVVNSEEVESEENNTSNAQQSVNPELLAAAQAATSSGLVNVSGEEESVNNESPETTVTNNETKRILPTDDMIHIDPVVISPLTTPTNGALSTEREGFQGGSAGSVMFDKIRS